MKNISANMQALLDSDGIRGLSTFYLIKRRDGTLLGFTDWTENVSFAGVTFQAAEGYSRSSLQQRADLAPANMEVTGIVTSGMISDEDIRAGLYNNATIQVWMAVPTDANFLTYGRIPLPGAYLGEIKIQDGTYVLEIRGWSYLLQQSYVELYTPTCRADFCDKRCKLVASDYTIIGTVVGAGQPINISVTTWGPKVSDGLTFATLTSATGGSQNKAPVFTYGTITFTSGKNENYTVEVSNAVYNGDGTVGLYLYLPAPFQVSDGDTVSVLAGCDKTINTCLGYNNVANFRGEPFIPGMNFLFDYGEVSP